jgi:hypothetical protein
MSDTDISDNEKQIVPKKPRPKVTPATDEEMVEMQKKMEERPSKLAHIKNKNIIQNSWDPINEKYVKKIWAHKKTKLDREKRDLIWEYYRHRNKWPVTEAFKKTYYKNVRDVVVIYFDDPVQHRFLLDLEMIDKIRKYEPPKGPKEPKVPKVKKERKPKRIPKKLAVQE